MPRSRHGQLEFYPTCREVKTFATGAKVRAKYKLSDLASATKGLTKSDLMELTNGLK
jgi:hypothetical protein